jgi:SAM-dependent methyltransferase
MTAEEAITAEWDIHAGPADGLTDEDLVRGWDGVAEWWTSFTNPRGDRNREWVIDPVLFEYLGDMEGLRILDAGCGAGYLARLLTRRGAVVTGVDFSPKLLAMAQEEEARDPLGVTYRQADLADLGPFEDETFDVAVSNVVLQDIRRYREAIAEIQRVLRPGGRFLFSVTHPAFDRPPAQWLQEPEDSERVERRRLLMDRYFERVAIYWSPRGKPAAPGFHRPLRDYFEALHAAGFVVLRLEEPLPSEEALEKHYREFVDFFQAPNFIVVEAQKLASVEEGRAFDGD